MHFPFRSLCLAGSRACGWLVPALQQEFDFYPALNAVSTCWRLELFSLHLPPGEGGCDCLPVRLATIFYMPPFLTCLASDWHLWCFLVCWRCTIYLVIVWMPSHLLTPIMATFAKTSASWWPRPFSAVTWSLGQLWLPCLPCGWLPFDDPVWSGNCDVITAVWHWRTDECFDWQSRSDDLEKHTKRILRALLRLCTGRASLHLVHCFCFAWCLLSIPFGRYVLWILAPAFSLFVALWVHWARCREWQRWCWFPLGPGPVRAVFVCLHWDDRKSGWGICTSSFRWLSVVVVVVWLPPDLVQRDFDLRILCHCLVLIICFCIYKGPSLWAESATLRGKKIELLERFGFLARCPEFMMYFHACPILDYCAHFAVYFLAFLLFPVLPICFLHRFYIRKFIIYFPEPLIYCQWFPSWFSRSLFFPYPRASFKVLDFSAYLPEFRQLFYFLVISIGSFLFVYFCEFWFVSLSLSPLYFRP